MENVESAQTPKKLLHLIFGNALLFSAYYLAAIFSNKLGVVSGFAPLIWAPSGISLAAFLVYGEWLWPAVLLGAISASTFAGADILTASVIAVGNTLETYVGLRLLRWAEFRMSLERLRDVFGFILLAASASTLISATIGSSVLYTTRELSEGFGATWRAWWLGDMVGELLLVPFFLVWREESASPWRGARIVEAMAILAVVALACFALFTDWFNLSRFQGFPRSYLIFPLVVIVALRLGQRGVATANMIIAGFVIGATLLQGGVFWAGSVIQSLFNVQFFLAVLVITKMVLAAALAERGEKQEELRRTEEATRFLSAATKKISSSIDYETTLQNVVHAVVPAWADLCALQIVEREREFKRIEFAISLKDKEPIIREFIPKFLARAYGPSITAGVIREGKGRLFVDISKETRHAENLDKSMKDLIALIGIESITLSPLYLYNGMQGSIALCSCTPGRRYDSRDLLLHEEFGRRAAIAIGNAHHYLEAQEAIRARDEFLSVASHELKTPLTSLALQLEILCREMKKKETQGAVPEKTGSGTEFLNAIAHGIDLCLRQTKRLNALLEEVLDLTRIRLGRMEIEKEKVDLAVVASEILGHFEAEATLKGVPISLKAAPEVVGFWDRTRVEQIVSNLISNALKYGGGKPISIIVEKDDAARKARLIVKDQGMGISPEMQRRIFERFERGSAGGKKIAGLGLGLYISRQVANAHGGTISVQSEEGKGSTFTVELPLGIPQEAAVREPALQRAG